ncbi:MAG TPA: AAA family ATPase, partial [Coriobacteriia bacterium]
QGRVVSFRNVIVIMTSNVGSQFQQFVEQGSESEAAKLAEEALRATFRPEFLNRIDDIVTFHQLTLEQIERIVDLQLEQVRARLAERKIALVLTPAALERIGLDGFDPQFGARPLKRAIQREVVDRVAKAMIDGTVGEGSTVTVDIGDDGELLLAV